MFFVCLCEGLISDTPYTFIDGVLRDGDGEEIKLVDPVVVESTDTGEVTMITGAVADPELQELEERGGGYLSADDDDNCFTIDDDGDKYIVVDK